MYHSRREKNRTDTESTVLLKYLKIELDINLLKINFVKLLK